MRAMTIVLAIAGLLVVERGATADERPIYKCDQFKEGGDCICGTGQEPADDGNRKICVRPLRLRAPADGEVVDTATEFSVDARDAPFVQIEVCLVRSCRKHFTIFKQKVSRGRVTFPLSSVPSDIELYWRARAIRGGKFGRPTSLRRFRTVARPPDPARIDLGAVDRLIATGGAAAVVESARHLTSSADLVEIALRLAKANRCNEVNEVIALPAIAGNGLESQLAQVQTDCDAALTNKAMIDAINDGLPTIAEEALAAFRDKHPQSMDLTFWSQSYLAAMSKPPRCVDARRFSVLAKRKIGLRPEDFSALIAIAIFCSEPSPAPSEGLQLAGGVATVDYQIPIAGRRTGAGLRYFIGPRFHDGKDDETSLAYGIVAMRPFQAGVDGRLGAVWGAGILVSHGGRKPAPLTARLEIEISAARGKYFVEGLRKTSLVMDSLVGIAIGRQISGHLLLTARAGVRLGFLVDFTDQPANNDGFLDRWHGMIAFDSGLALEVR